MRLFIVMIVDHPRQTVLSIKECPTNLTMGRLVKCLMLLRELWESLLTSKSGKRHPSARVDVYM